MRRGLCGGGPPPRPEELMGPSAARAERQPILNGSRRRNLLVPLLIFPASDGTFAVGPGRRCEGRSIPAKLVLCVVRFHRVALMLRQVVAA